MIEKGYKFYFHEESAKVSELSRVESLRVTKHNHHRLPAESSALLLIRSGTFSLPPFLFIGKRYI